MVRLGNDQGKQQFRITEHLRSVVKPRDNVNGSRVVPIQCEPAVNSTSDPLWMLWCGHQEIQAFASLGSVDIRMYSRPVERDGCLVRIISGIRGAKSRRAIKSN